MYCTAIHGHRGARGHAPENTLAGFETALRFGVTALELDINVTSDHKIVIYHDPRLNPAITRNPNGTWITDSDQRLYGMSLADLGQLDVGCLDTGTPYGRDFPYQRPVHEQRIPTLPQLAEVLRRLGADRVLLNIEVKIDPRNPEWSPPPSKYATLLLEELNNIGWLNNSWVQSFDWRVLQAVQAQEPAVPTGYLTSEQPGFNTVAVNRLNTSPWLAGFDPVNFNGDLTLAIKQAGGRYWGPNYLDLTERRIQNAHQAGLEVHTWTVNESKDIATLSRWGVNGVTSDYPDRVRSALLTLGVGLPSPITGELFPGA
jgi:glycerophosphoryl diester phosphodiesterase